MLNDILFVLNDSPYNNNGWIDHVFDGDCSRCLSWSFAFLQRITIFVNINSSSCPHIIVFNCYFRHPLLQLPRYCKAPSCTVSVIHALTQLYLHSLAWHCSCLNNWRQGSSTFQKLQLIKQRQYNIITLFKGHKQDSGSSLIVCFWGDIHAVYQASREVHTAVSALSPRLLVLACHSKCCIISLRGTVYPGKTKKELWVQFGFLHSRSRAERWFKPCLTQLLRPRRVSLRYTNDLKRRWIGFVAL